MRALRLVLPAALVVAAIAGACSSGGDGGSGDLPVDDSAVPLDFGTDSVRPPDDSGFPIGPFDDFPSTPILDAPTGGTATPPSAPTLFGPPASGDASGGPCLIEPEIGSLFPRNWLRPRFRFAAGGGENLFEIRLHADDEKSDLVVYTTSTTWTMPADMWSKLTNHVIDKPITVTIRGAVYDGSKLTAGPSIGSSGTITIAPADADGTIVYWVLPGGSTSVSTLKGFNVGQDTVQTVLTPTQASTACVGCHTSTPDGNYVAFSSSDNAGDGSGSAWMALRSVKDPTAEPPFLTAIAKTLIGRKDQHAGSFSRAHWSPGDRVMLSILPVAGKAELVWTDLEATSADVDKGWGIVARTGDAQGAAGPSFSHDGTKVIYFSAPDVGAGEITAGNGDLFIVPYADRKGGAVTPLASDPSSSSFYPQFSADDRLVAFNKVPRGQTSYNDPADEIYVVPSSGGGASVRLKANDPPACTGSKSPGVTNSWPKWSPKATPSGSKTYYWLTFSSTRVDGKNPQLYVTGIVVEGSTITTYPALYLWNQPGDEHNHTPAWDVFAIPPPH